MFWTRIPILVLLLGLQPQAEVDIAWPLQHDRAAIYNVVDGSTGLRIREFWLLGCELFGPIDALNTAEIPLRYAFHLPKEKLKHNATWSLKDRVYSECFGFSAPLEVSGGYRLRPIKSIRLADVIKSLGKDKKDKTTEPFEAAIIEGHFQANRGNWVNDKAGSFEQNPSATFSTLSVVRLSDRAIVGVSYQWNGRSEEYTSTYSSPAVARRTISRDLIFQESYVEISKDGLRERIERAVESGVKWLRSTQTPTGTFSDPLTLTDKWSYAKEFVTALSLMALTHCGLPYDDKAVKSGFAYLDSRRPVHAWDIGLALMAIESKYLPLTFYEDLPRYSEEKARQEISGRISKQDKTRAEDLASLLIGYQGKHGGFGYAEGDSENIQTTQYAVLGLKSASRLGVRIPTGTWRGIVKYLETTTASSGQSAKLKVAYLDGRKERETTGYELGWSYRPSPDRRTLPPKYTDTNGTRVMSALACAAIAHSELKYAQALDEDVARRLDDLTTGGLAWWARHIGLRTAQHEGCLDLAALTYFYLWSVERTAVFLSIERINDHAWYYEGAAHILSAQAPDGRWDGSRGIPITDTACALLFLKRATIPVETPAGAGKRAVATEGEKKPADPEK